MKSTTNKLITTLTVLALMLGVGMVNAMAGSPFATPPFATPTFATEEAALDVYRDGTCLHSFTMQELEEIAKTEGAKKYTFSSFNTYPSPQLSEEVEGPTVEGILNEALEQTGETTVQIGDLQLIGFRASDGLEEKFMKQSLLCKRWYYPNFRQEQGRSGHAVLESSMADPSEVPAVISLREEGKAHGEEGHYDVGRLLFGQLVPNEQNHSMFVKYMATKDTEKIANRGRITIYSDTAQTLRPISTTDQGKSGAVKTGTKIALDRSVNPSHTEGGSRYWIFFTTDGSEPDMTSEMYNYNNLNFGSASEKINYPVMTDTDTVTLKTRVCSYDRVDSEVASFTFCQPLGTPVMKKLTGKGKSITVNWKAVAHAEGYQIQRSMKKSGGFKTVKTVKGGKTVSWKNSGLKKGKTYYYRVREYRTVGDSKVYSSYSAVKYKKVK